jgi:hypothetical protein
MVSGPPPDGAGQWKVSSAAGAPPSVAGLRPLHAAATPDRTHAPHFFRERIHVLGLVVGRDPHARRRLQPDAEAVVGIGRRARLDLDAGGSRTAYSYSRLPYRPGASEAQPARSTQASTFAIRCAAAERPRRSDACPVMLSLRPMPPSLRRVNQLGSSSGQRDVVVSAGGRPCCGTARNTIRMPSISGTRRFTRALGSCSISSTEPFAHRTVIAGPQYGPSGEPGRPCCAQNTFGFGGSSPNGAATIDTQVFNATVAPPAPCTPPPCASDRETRPPGSRSASCRGHNRTRLRPAWRAGEPRRGC